MNNLQHQNHLDAIACAAGVPWYAVRTKSNCERRAALSLEHKGYEQYLPLYHKVRRQFDRTIETEVPLFPGYVFCRLDPNIPFRIVTTPGVVSIVCFGDELTPVSDLEIEAVRTVLRSGAAAAPCPFLCEGQHICVIKGALSGVEGERKTYWEWLSQSLCFSAPCPPKSIVGLSLPSKPVFE